MRVVCNLCCPRCDSGSTATFCQASKERLPYSCWGWCCGSTAGKSKQLIASIRPTGRAARQAAWQSGGVPVESASLSEAITIYMTIFVRKFRFYVCQGGNLPPPLGVASNSQHAAPILPEPIIDHSSNMQLMTASLPWAQQRGNSGNWKCKVIISDSQKCIMQSGSFNCNQTLRQRHLWSTPRTHTHTWQVRLLTASQIRMIYG